ncbi:MAG: acyltransferase [Akkermansia sp.]|nr:acyltransferase [Akkermansia sp.]
MGVSKHLDNQKSTLPEGTGGGINPVRKEEKKRYEWIDNARIVAAWMIACAHMPFLFPFNSYASCSLAHKLTMDSVYHGRVPFFLILAGYFLGRKITWSKAFDRALWLLIPFFIWNFLYYAWTHHALHLDLLQTFYDVPKMLGVGAVFDKNWTICGLAPIQPSIGPTWFLRDIVVLSLITPILAKFKKALLVIVAIVCVLFAECDQTDAPVVLLLPATCAYYCLGISLSNYTINDAYLILNKRFTPFVVTGFLAAVCYVICSEYMELPPFPCTLLGGAFGALMIAQCGVLIEKHMPKLSKRLAPCGPACFLVFVLHMPLLRTLADILPREFCSGVWVWSFTVLCCGVIIAIFLLMKRYVPWLMPYLGHMKVPKKS